MAILAINGGQKVRSREYPRWPFHDLREKSALMRVTRNSHHLFLLRFHSEAFGGVSKNVFVKALAAEGIPAAPGYLPLHRQPLFDQPRVRQVLCRDIHYAELPLPVTQRASTECFWITQNTLLGNERDLQDIRSAVIKLRDNAGKLRQNSLEHER